jgi:hypothetical protein
LKATNALASFVYNNPRVQSQVAKQYQFPFEYFQKFLQSNNEHTRCAAAFQVCCVDLDVFNEYQNLGCCFGCFNS